MKLEGTLKVVKRKIGAVDIVISGIKAMRNNIRMEFEIKDPSSIADAGTILIEIPDAKKPDPPKKPEPEPPKAKEKK